MEYKSVTQGYKSTIEKLELKSELFKSELLSTRVLLNKSNHQVLYYKSELLLADVELHRIENELMVQKEQIKSLLKKNKRKKNIIVVIGSALVTGAAYIFL